jgi:hypothetical protein
VGLWASFQASVRYDVRLAAGPAIVSLLTASFAVAAGGAAWRARRRSRRHDVARRGGAQPAGAPA